MKSISLTILLSITVSIQLIAQKAQWSFELLEEIPYNITMPLVIKQKGEEVLHLNAQYNSEPLAAPVCWIWRFTRWENDRSWEFEAIHHKLYLENKTSEIQRFSISHGHNILTLNRSYKKLLFQKYSYMLRFGAGVVLSHPESEIRNKEFYEHEGIFELGYYFTGPVLNFAIAKQFHFTKRFFLNAEIKTMPSVSWVPIADGHAVVWNLPVAFALGVGVDFIKSK